MSINNTDANSDVLGEFTDRGGAFISLVAVDKHTKRASVLARMFGRKDRTIEVERELRARKWSKIVGIEGDWLMFAPVEFDLPPGNYVAVTARAVPFQEQPTARMDLRQHIPAAGRVRITPKVKV